MMSDTRALLRYVLGGPAHDAIGAETHPTWTSGGVSVGLSSPLERCL